MPACALAQASWRLLDLGCYQVAEAILSSRRLIPEKEIPIIVYPGWKLDLTGIILVR